MNFLAKITISILRKVVLCSSKMRWYSSKRYTICLRCFTSAGYDFMRHVAKLSACRFFTSFLWNVHTLFKISEFVEFLRMNAFNQSPSKKKKKWFNFTLNADNLLRCLAYVFHSSYAISADECSKIIARFDIDFRRVTSRSTTKWYEHEKKNLWNVFGSNFARNGFISGRFTLTKIGRFMSAYRRAGLTQKCTHTHIHSPYVELKILSFHHFKCPSDW